MTKLFAVPIDHKFKGRGGITCQVTSGKVSITINNSKIGEYGGGQGFSDHYTTTKETDEQWEVIVTGLAGKTEVTFTAPDS